MSQHKKRKNRKRKRHQSKLSIPLVPVSRTRLSLPPALPAEPGSRQPSIQIPWVPSLVVLNRYQRIILAAFKPRWLAPVIAAGVVLLGPRSFLLLPPQYASYPQILAQAYPEAIDRPTHTPGGWLITFNDRREEWYSAGRFMSWQERFDHPDLASILSQPYPFGPVPLPRPSGQDPGRIRHYDLLRAAYGRTPQEVRRNLEVVDFFGNAVWFNRRNGAAAALRGVVREMKADPEVCTYIERIARPYWRRFSRGRTAGLRQGRYITSWEWRRVAGTRQLSAHSFGIALDINNPFTRLPKYWEWKRPVAGRIEEVPWRLVEIFERHGFIWGGKWHHFDTMHFEYRPEFLVASQMLDAPETARSKPAAVPWLKTVLPRRLRLGD
ncbi:MAG: M15 family metallopeptidase [candidate division FCPU426 bacterium]